MINSISFKADVPTSTPATTPAPVAAPADKKSPENLGNSSLKVPEATEAPALATPAKADTVSFSGKKATKDEVTAEKTHFFRNAGAIIGGALGLGLTTTALVLRKNPKAEIQLSKAIGLSIALPLIGALDGILGDFVINKIVKNTTQSVMNNLKQEIQQ